MLNQVCEILRDVGEILLDIKSKGGDKGYWEGTQFHARADEHAHNLICSRLVGLKEKYPIVSEESGNEIIPSEPKFWLVDPIDGTASYAHGFSGYVTQIALMENFQPVLSAIYAPATEEMFSAKKGKGAFKNGIRLPSMQNASITLIDNYPEPRGVAKNIYDALELNSYMESGSLGLKICRVAEGAADIFVKDVVVRDWDLAAPELVLKEAGGTLTDQNNEFITYTGTSSQEGIMATRDLTLSKKLYSLI